MKVEYDERAFNFILIAAMADAKNRLNGAIESIMQARYDAQCEDCEGVRKAQKVRALRQYEERAWGPS